MDKSKFYKISAIALLLINIAAFTFFFLSKPSHKEGPPKNHDFRIEVVDILGLNEKQENKFIESVERHKDMMHRISEKQSRLMESYFRGLTGVSESVNNEEILDMHCRLEQEKIEQTYLHFKEIKQLLTPDQKEKYKKFLERATDVLLTKNHPKPPPRR